MKKDELKKIKAMDLSKLVKKIQEARDELFDLKMKAKMNELENTQLVKTKKKDIARMLTVKRAKELIKNA